MSDDWMVHVKKLAFGVLLAATIQNAEIKTIVVASGPSGPSQEWIKNDNALRAIQGALDLSPELTAPAPENQTLVNPPAESRNKAQQAQSPQEWQKELDEVDERLGDIDDVVQLTVETEEDRRRQSPAGKLELLQAREVELAELLKTQKEQRADQKKQIDEHRDKLENKYAESPELQKQHLETFDKVAKAADKEMGDHHTAQLQQFEDRWEQKYQEFQENPLIIPTDPDRDHR